MMRLLLQQSRRLPLAKEMIAKYCLSSTPSLATARSVRPLRRVVAGSTTVRLHSTDRPEPDEIDKKVKEEELEQERFKAEDPCPEWQNPLLHNNPEVEKIFEEDFPPGEMPVLPAPPVLKPGDDPRKILAPDHLQELAGEMLQLNMLEMRELIKRISEHFNLANSDPMVDADSDGEGEEGDDDEDEGEGEAAAAEKTVFDVKLTGFDAKAKIKVIKEVRALAGLGLKEAKEVVESAPTVIMKDLKKETAEELKQKLEDIGATIEIV